MSRHFAFLCTPLLTLMFAVLPGRATTSCLLDFTSGNNNTYLKYDLSL